ncbi:ABC-type nitrate/sulfonate/bicarbonate transport system permease component [Bradyrhizobium japonicum]|uniref:ABC transporter permease n=1 Tax=Bradyrhizobium TaxID=374 RepID=UPI00040864D7|nr:MULTISPECIES: ABC transporter permease subunit [Bradyrhizobium]MBR0999566.1 ABC transporter permease subunit [Bradyrhizobium liaoningense]MBR1065220.1 ABC transporter permease subunit [Bradyrhizobium liaoningense]MCP1740158.1 ABC-type nitrate/sulfonate/bicarbonate transport system permease component [Bradyrhizobium japonicum]MCP1778391.1 ABC-type nitrate/sulfonate/bicarbonate transport system permease component [Bradyrhizobium japonicum]MCP1857834.1 ABC-type nitrate/sulfonate/bicarbonate tr
MIATNAPAQAVACGRGRRWGLHAAGNAWSALQGLLPLIALLLLWQVLGDPRSPYFPPPSRWAAALIDRTIAGDLVPAVLVTFQSVAAALVLATALGVGIGWLIGASPGLARCLGPTLEFLRTLPPPTIVPVAALIVGVNEKMKLFVIVFAALWPVLLNTTSGVRSLHPTLLEAARSLQLGVIARVTKIFLPALLPSILTGVRVAAPLAIIVSLLAEMLTLMPGLGALLLMAQRNFNAAEVFGLLAVVGSFGFIINAALAAFESWALMPQGRS